MGNRKRKGKVEGEGEGKGKRKRKGKVEGRELKKSWTHGQMHGRTNRHSGDFILCPMLCTAMDGQ